MNNTIKAAIPVTAIVAVILIVGIVFSMLPSKSTTEETIYPKISGDENAIELAGYSVSKSELYDIIRTATGYSNYIIYEYALNEVDKYILENELNYTADTTELRNRVVELVKNDTYGTYDQETIDEMDEDTRILYELQYYDSLIADFDYEFPAGITNFNDVMTNVEAWNTANLDADMVAAYELRATKYLYLKNELLTSDWYTEVSHQLMVDSYTLPDSEKGDIYLSYARFSSTSEIDNFFNLIGVKYSSRRFKKEHYCTYEDVLNQFNVCVSSYLEDNDDETTGYDSEADSVVYYTDGDGTDSFITILSTEDYDTAMKAAVATVKANDGTITKVTNPTQVAKSSSSAIYIDLEDYETFLVYMQMMDYTTGTSLYAKYLDLVDNDSTAEENLANLMYEAKLDDSFKHTYEELNDISSSVASYAYGSTLKGILDNSYDSEDDIYHTSSYTTKDNYYYYMFKIESPTWVASDLEDYKQEKIDELLESKLTDAYIENFFGHQRDALEFTFYDNLFIAQYSSTHLFYSNEEVEENSIVFSYKKDGVLLNVTADDIFDELSDSYSKYYGIAGMTLSLSEYTDAISAKSGSDNYLKLYAEYSDTNSTMYKLIYKQLQSTKAYFATSGIGQTYDLTWSEFLTYYFGVTNEKEYMDLMIRTYARNHFWVNTAIDEDKEAIMSEIQSIMDEYNTSQYKFNVLQVLITSDVNFDGVADDLITNANELALADDSDILSLFGTFLSMLQTQIDDYVVDVCETYGSALYADADHDDENGEYFCVDSNFTRTTDDTEETYVYEVIDGTFNIFDFDIDDANTLFSKVRTSIVGSLYSNDIAKLEALGMQFDVLYSGIWDAYYTEQYTAESAAFDEALNACGVTVDTEGYEDGDLIEADIDSRFTDGSYASGSICDEDGDGNSTFDKDSYMEAFIEATMEEYKNTVISEKITEENEGYSFRIGYYTLTITQTTYTKSDSYSDEFNAAMAGFYNQLLAADCDFGQLDNMIQFTTSTLDPDDLATVCDNDEYEDTDDNYGQHSLMSFVANSDTMLKTDEGYSLFLIDYFYSQSTLTASENEADYETDKEYAYPTWENVLDYIDYQRRYAVDSSEETDLDDDIVDLLEEVFDDIYATYETDYSFITYYIKYTLGSDSTVTTTSEDYEYLMLLTEIFARYDDNYEEAIEAAKTPVE